MQHCLELAQEKVPRIEHMPYQMSAQYTQNLALVPEAQAWLQWASAQWHIIAELRKGHAMRANCPRGQE